MPGFSFASIKSPAANPFEITVVILVIYISAVCYQIDQMVCHDVKKKKRQLLGVELTQ